MTDSETQKETTSTTEITVSGPKFQATVPKTTRELLGLDKLDQSEKAILEVQFSLKSIKQK